MSVILRARPSGYRRVLLALLVAAAVFVSIVAQPVTAQAAGAAGWITGRVTVPGGTAANWYQSVYAELVDSQGDFLDDSAIAADGTYALPVPAAGKYRVYFAVYGSWDSGLGRDVKPNLQDEYYGNTYAMASAPEITVTAGATVTGINAQLDTGGTISGRVTAPTAVDGAWTEATSVDVYLNGSDYSDSVWLGTDGTYSITGLPTGYYRVIFSFNKWYDPWTSGGIKYNLASEAYVNTYYPSAANLVYVSAGTTAQNIDGTLDPGATISGTVTAPGYPEPYWQADTYVTLYNDQWGFSDEYVDASGNFAITGIPAGTYYLGAATFDGSGRPLIDLLGGTRTVTVGGPGTSQSGLNIAFSVQQPADVSSVTPARLADLSQVTPGAAPRCVNVAGALGVPANATGVVFNVTAAGATGPGNAVVYPDTAGNNATTPPNASTVNFESGRDVANSAFVKLPADGDVCVAVQGAKLGRLILDVTGYVTGEAGVSLISAERVLDTRAGSYHVGALTGPVAPGYPSTVRIAGTGSVPWDAVGVIANVTVTGVTGPGHLKVWAADGARPNTSVVNYAAGQDKANGQYLALSADGKIKLESVAASAHVIIDVVGYVTASSPIVSTAPTRIVETRASEGRVGPIPGRLATQQVYSVEVPTSVVPAGATSVILNVTAVQPSGLGHLRVYPDTAGNGATMPPDTSNLNYIPGRDIPNMVVVQLPADRRVNFYSVNSTTDMVVDVIGYIKAPAS